MQSISITNVQAAKEALKVVDLYLKPPVHSFGLTDFDKVSEVSQLGYEYAREALAEAEEDGTLARLDLERSAAG